MKITARLAYSQLKVNRSRTTWSVIAIMLSTALMTAICLLAASTNAMLVSFLGNDYGEYANSYQVLLAIPMTIFGMLIMAMSITVISNVFRISTQDRMGQFGIMKCTGATPKQIKDTILYECAWLCMIGIPIGIGLGLILAFVGTKVVNHFLQNLNALTHIMIKEINLSLHFVFSWKALIFSAVFSALIVFYSAWRPAHKAAKISAIDCIHGTGEIVVEEKPLRENKLVRKLFGFEGTLADRNLKRNHRNFRATVIALSVGVILFVSLGGLANEAKGIQDLMNLRISETVIAEYMSDHSEVLNENTGRDETTYSCPIDSECGEKITQELKKYENASIWGMGNDMDTYFTKLSADLVTDEMKRAQDENEGESAEEYEFPVEIITLDQENYKKLCEKANVPVGSNLLLNHYNYNDFGHEVNLQPFSTAVKQLKLMKADGSEADIQIQGMLTEEQMPAEMFYFNTRPVRLVVPDAMVRGFTWYAKPEDEKGFMEYANKVLEEQFPSQMEYSYMEEGFDTRVYRLSEYMQVMNIAISVVAVFMYSFVALLMLIGLTNVISTLSTNVMMRAKEFAVLKSVGMTPEGLRHMLNYESILCSLKALIIGVPVGIVMTILVNLPVRMVYPIPYEFPWLSVLLSILVVLLITLGTTRYATHRLENQNIIEAIRAECGK